MQQDSVVRFRRPGDVHDELTERLRSGARRLLEEAITVELEEFLSSLSKRRDARGQTAVVRTGFQGAQSRRRTGVVSVEAGAAVCAADPFP